MRLIFTILFAFGFPVLASPEPAAPQSHGTVLEPSHSEVAQVATPAVPSTASSPASLIELCKKQLQELPHADKMSRIPELCKEAKQLPGCVSVKNEAILHFDRAVTSTSTTPQQKILVFSLTHGDETPSGAVTLSWLNRLREFEPRNSWRVIPILNPDGWHAKTRTNANGVDINRNFPSKDWDKLAHLYWKDKAKSEVRRFPGETSGSEPETKCAMQHIDDFKPDFIISIHTPLATLDFDGPRLKFPAFKPLPWVSLGNFPGSLGRYMWVDRRVPVLTVELAQNTIAIKQLEQFDRLQDLTGTIALQAEKAMQSEKPARDKGAKAATSGTGG